MRSPSGAGAGVRAVEPYRDADESRAATAEAPLKAWPAAARPLPGAWRCRVLIVDDDIIVQAQLGGLLRDAGFEVHCASCVAEAARVLGSLSCQILITDWQMPGKDGLALCRDVRDTPGDAYVYVLVLTVRSSKQDLLQALAAGADDVIVKGTSGEELLARLEVARRITRLEYALRRSNEENLRLAVTDPLTGIHNRRYLRDYLPRELERARRYGRPLSLLSCDLDDFKRVNDQWGHDAGDRVLQEFVAATRRCIRGGSDWLARVGGDEFIVVLPETPLAGATSLAERVRSQVAADPVVTGQARVHYTVSIGVTSVESPAALAATSVEGLLRSVDHGAYASKRKGRNQITVVPLPA